MIIDIHCHYTTEPAALHAFRDRQLAGLADPARRPTARRLADLGISDEALVQSVQPQLKLQRERGSDLTIFSPRAAGMAHHVGNAAGMATVPAAIPAQTKITVSAMRSGTSLNNSPTGEPNPPSTATNPSSRLQSKRSWIRTAAAINMPNCSHIDATSALAMAVSAML